MDRKYTSSIGVIMKRFLLAVSIYLFSTFSLAQVCADQAYGGKVPSSRKELIVLCKSRFAIGFNPKTKSAAWVAYSIRPEYLAAAGMPRAFSFKADPALPLDIQGTSKDYEGSGYDRGHIVPYEDINDDEQAARESFYFSNAVPQPYQFNRGIWKSLEMGVRSVGGGRDLFVVAGPIFPKYPKYLTSIPIPDAMFKIIVDPVRKTSMTYIIPNTSTVKTSQLPTFVTTLAEVTRLTGINPLPTKKRLTQIMN